MHLGGLTLRCLLGAVVLAATVPAGIGCGWIRSEDVGDAPRSRGNLTESELALCEMREAQRTAGESPLATVVASGDRRVSVELVAIGLFLDDHDDVRQMLGPFAPAANVIERRFEALQDSLDDLPEDADVVTPTVEPTADERASLRAADRFLAKHVCPRSD